MDCVEPWIRVAPATTVRVTSVRGYVSRVQMNHTPNFPPAISRPMPPLSICTSHVLPCILGKLRRLSFFVHFQPIMNRMQTIVGPVVRTIGLGELTLLFGTVLFGTGSFNLVSASEPKLAADSEASAEHLQLFTESVLPILKEHCFECHTSGKQKGGLSLDSRAGLVRGGDSGPAFDESDTEASAILEAVRYEGYEMPPRGKLAPELIEKIELWVAAGAPYSPDMQGSDEAQRPEPPGADVSESDREFWAFQPLADPAVPEVENRDYVSSPIDTFIAQKIEQAGLTLGSRAEPGPLLRRLHYDLTGLPPSRALVDAFVANPSDEHYARIVDRLLASPEYGQRWGRHWLDLVRYAETNSYERDDAKPEVWRYRDYVVDSLNQGKPFNEFASEQLAGDEMPFEPDNLIATGYYRLGLWDDEPADPLQARYDDLDDIVMTTGQVFLGLTVNCARCHDHKIDPIRQADYYRFLGFFAGLNRYGVRGHDSVERQSLRPLVPPQQGRSHIEEVQRYRNEKGGLERTLNEVNNKVRKDFVPVEREEFRHDMNRVAIVKKRVGTLLTEEEFANYSKAFEQLQALERNKPEDLAMALCVTEQGSTAQETFVLTRGNPHAPAAKVQPGFPEILSDPKFEGGLDPIIPPSSNPETSGRRTVLANWISDSRSNPLTPRVMANRIWQYHFGRGIVRTPSDFGFQGTAPTHPELLDWLASRLVEADWHLKPLHRMILTSTTYRLSTQARERELNEDPSNDLFWRFDPRRLSAEEIRDSMLAVTGRLNFQMGGPSMYPIIEAEVLAGQSRPGAGWGNSSEADRSRRSLYIHLKRSLAVPLLASFDMADTDFTCPVRFATTQPTQALGMINSAFVRRQAELMAQDVVRSVGEQPSDFAFELLSRVTQRTPTKAEVSRAIELMEKLTRERGETDARAREHLTLVALNLNEFVYLD
jgi:mono/diheme cytochrome c family protein